MADTTRVIEQIKETLVHLEDQRKGTVARREAALTELDKTLASIDDSIQAYSAALAVLEADAKPAAKKAAPKK